MIILTVLGILYACYVGLLAFILTIMTFQCGSPAEFVAEVIHPEKYNILGMIVLFGVFILIPVLIASILVEIIRIIIFMVQLIFYKH